LARQALATLEDLLAEGDREGSAPRPRAAADAGVTHRSCTLAALEAEAQCFELAEKEHRIVDRMPGLLLRAASRHAANRGYHVTGERISQALADRAKVGGPAQPGTPISDPGSHQ
jgi:hypothetical protein